MKKNRRPEPAAIEQEELVARFQLRERFLLESELECYRLLNQAIDDRAIVCPKPRVLEALRVLNASAHLEAALRIDRKHVDFLICDLATGHPCCAIQLDWWDSNSQQYRPREPLLEQAFKLAGLPVIHVPSNDLPNVKTLKQQIRTLLDPDFQGNIIRSHVGHGSSRQSKAVSESVGEASVAHGD